MATTSSSNMPGWIALGVAAATLVWTMFWSVFQNRRTTNPRLHVRTAHSIAVLRGQLGRDQLGVEVNNTGPVACQVLSVVLAVKGGKKALIPQWSLQPVGALPVTLEPGSGHWTGLIDLEELHKAVTDHFGSGDGRKVRAIVRIAGGREFRSRVGPVSRRRWFTL